MATPTERVTRHAQDYLAGQHDVILALRVDWGPDAVKSRKKFGYGFWARAYLWSPIVLPIMALLRRPQALETRIDPSSGTGILALSADDGRILLSAPPQRKKTPTGIVEALPQASPIQVDVDLMETHMIPSLTVAHREFVVNGIDFRALLKAVENLTIRSPEIKAVLPRLKDVGSSPYSGVPSQSG